MGISYHFSFSAPGDTPAEILEDFLYGVEDHAKEAGFDPVLVLNARFDTPERQMFARRLTTGLPLKNEKLKSVATLRAGQVWHHDPSSGSCRVIPESGVFMVVTDAQRQETVFGFLKFPRSLKDFNGIDLLETGARDWIFRDFVNSPDPRFREIVKRFSEAGYTESEQDEFK